MNYKSLTSRLATIYPATEAQALARWVMEECFGLSLTDILLGKDNDLSANDQAELQIIADRLLKNEPLQYILGHTTFCDLRIAVAPGVLIPRPETAELVELIDSEWNRKEISTDEKDKNCTTERRPRVLDIGTGSGCIALALAARDYEVEAWDVSEEALAIARRNAADLRLDVDFQHRDILQEAEAATNSKTDEGEHEGDANTSMKWDIIVSNPPYIRQSEAAAMEANVLEHEPYLALFVPDSDPLVFYRAIALFARRNLRSGGRLYFEINQALGAETVALLQDAGFNPVTLHRDQFGNDRMVTSQL